jgi:predicted transcriptional regulator
MDFQGAENQAQQLQQQATQVTQRLKDLADKLQTRIADQNLAREKAVYRNVQIGAVSCG